MKSSIGTFFRKLTVPMLGAAAAGTLLLGSVGCSKSSSNPDAVGVDELKGPGHLTIADMGNGKVTLNFTAANNETKFDGFNVYGMRSTAGDGSDLGAPAGTAIELLDDSGNARAEAKATLAKFDYDPTAGKMLEVAGTGGAPADPSSKDTPEFSLRPIHKMASSDATKMALPTCQISGSTTCTTTTDVGAKTVADVPGLAANGVISYDVSQTDTLKVGESYCFLVLSSEKEGEVVSQTSSDVACVTPKYSTKTSITMPASTTYTDSQVFDFTKWLAACKASTDGKCTDPVTGSTKFVTVDANTTAKSRTATDTGPLYFEYAGADGNGVAAVGFNAGAGVGVADLGYHGSLGFADFANLPDQAPTFVPDSKSIFNGGGYSLSGQTLPIKPQHIYVVAVPDAALAGKFNYYWLYFSDATITAGNAAAVEIRMTAASM